MKKFVGPLALMLVTAVGSHFAVLYSAPNFIMSRAMTLLAGNGSGLHGFTLAKRTTPQTQKVVRSSPDLAYSSCLFDMIDAPSGILVRMAKTDGYSSLSFYDASTNNFETIRGNGREIEVRLLPPNSRLNGPEEIVAPSNKGIILIRRLAPDQAQYDNVVAVSSRDQCAPIKS